MKMGVYAIYDATAEVFMRPMFLVNDATAIRGFINAVLNEKSDLFTNPGDFTLYKVDEWDDVEGRFEMLEIKQQLGNGLSLLAQYKEDLTKAAQLQKQVGELTNLKTGDSFNA